MRILHVLSQTELTGAEVYAKTLGEYQVKMGHGVLVVSDKLHIPTSLPVFFQPISNRRWSQRIKNIFFLRKLVKEHEIDIVHAHSRAASWVSFWATFRSSTALVSTVHGRQHLHFSLRLYSVYGDRIIGICQSVREHLVKEVGLVARKISVIPNGFEFTDKLPAVASIKAKKLFLVGRTSGPKGERSRHLIQNIFPRLLEKFSDLEISIAGGTLSNFDEKTIHALNEMKARFSTRITVRESLSREMVDHLMKDSSHIVGSGRLAIKALSQGKKTFAIGEASCEGMISKNNLSKAIATNFGDILPDKKEDIDYELLASEMESFVADNRSGEKEIIERINKFFSIERVERAISAVYFEALLERRIPKRIPILMYHKIVDEAYSSKHKTYVSLETFTRHLKILRMLGFSAITFQDLKEATLFKKVLPAKPIILTFDDGYKKSLERALPVLIQEGFRAVFYVLGDRRFTENSWDEKDRESELINSGQICKLRELGMEIGAHSMTHRKLSELSESEIQEEVEESKKNLEALVGESVVSFAYPYGNISNSAKKIIKKAGFNFAVATDSGGLTLADDPFHIFRASIFPHDHRYGIRKKSSRLYRVYYALKRRKIFDLPNNISVAKGTPPSSIQKVVGR